MTLSLAESMSKFDTLIENLDVHKIRLIVNKDIEITLERSGFTNDIGIKHSRGAIWMTVMADNIHFTGDSLYGYRKGMCIARFDMMYIEQIRGYDEKGALIE